MLKDLTDYILTRISERQASGECTAVRTELTECYSESGQISLMRTVFQNSLIIKVIQDQRKGQITLNQFERSAIDDALQQAFAAARKAPANPAEGIAELVENQNFQMGGQQVERDKLYALLTGFIRDVKQEYPRISLNSFSVQHQNRDLLYANTNGVALGCQNGVVGYGGMFMAVDGARTSSFDGLQGLTQETDLPLIERDRVREILAATERQIETRTLDGHFVGDLILTPNLFLDVLRMVQQLFLSDGVLINETSLWKDKLGETVSSPLLTVQDAPLDPRLALLSPITADGYPAANHTLIDKGVLKNFSLSRYGAAKTGRARSATTGGHFIAEAGTESREELIKHVKRGLLINRFSGGSPAPNGDLTGVAKNSFLIEDGRISDAVSEVMISTNLAKMMHNIVALSRETASDGQSILPWVHVTDVTISGH